MADFKPNKQSGRIGLMGSGASRKGIPVATVPVGMGALGFMILSAIAYLISQQS